MRTNWLVNVDPTSALILTCIRLIPRLELATPRTLLNFGSYLVSHSSRDRDEDELEVSESGRAHMLGL